MTRLRWRDWVGYFWPAVAPALVCGLLFLLVLEPLRWWLQGDEIYDEQAMVEWLRESRIGFKTLPELLRELVDSARQVADKQPSGPDNSQIGAHDQKRAEIEEMLRAMAAPPTKIYPGQLPLFPMIFRLEIGFDDALQQEFPKALNFEPIVWDSDQPRRKAQYRRLNRADLVGE